MKQKINIAELLKDCPKDMELDCTMFEDVYFDHVDELDIIHCYIQHETHKTSITFNQHGQYIDADFAKCSIFPKGKTTWDGFVPPCKFKDGDILFVKSNYEWTIIYKESENDEDLYKYVATQNHSYHTDIICGDRPLCFKGNISEIRLATEEEKQKLFQAIKDNGYQWNAETKTLEWLIKPKFKVGDRIRRKGEISTYAISDVNDAHYFCGEYVICDTCDDDWELVPNKFDITTLKPFDKVLVKDTYTDLWHATFFSHIGTTERAIFETVCARYKQCIPYEGNEHLLGTANDCDEYYKTW